MHENILKFSFTCGGKRNLFNYDFLRQYFIKILNPSHPPHRLRKWLVLKHTFGLWPDGGLGSVGLFGGAGSLCLFWGANCMCLFGVSRSSAIPTLFFFLNPVNNREIHRLLYHLQTKIKNMENQIWSNNNDQYWCLFI